MNNLCHEVHVQLVVDTEPDFKDATSVSRYPYNWSHVLHFVKYSTVNSIKFWSTDTDITSLKEDGQSTNSIHAFGVLV